MNIVIPQRPALYGKPVTAARWVKNLLDTANGMAEMLSDEEIRNIGIAGLIEMSAEFVAEVED